MGKGTNRKSRYFAAALSFALLTFLTLALATNADAVLSAERGAATLNLIKMIVRALASRRCLLLWLLLDGLGVLGIYWALFGRSYLNYRSDMFEVVPGFEIPKPEGQGQHGTAWWLPVKEYGKVFNEADTSAPVPLSPELRRWYEGERSGANEIILPSDE